MDNFNVPKKVNRHVLKALHVLTEGDNRVRVSSQRIVEQVKYQMRNLVPVPNLSSVIRVSLRNLSACGLVKRIGVHSYGLGLNFAPPNYLRSPSVQAKRTNCSARPSSPQKKSVEPKQIFQPTTTIPVASESELNPNSKRKRYSDTSIADDEPNLAPKRMRTNNKQIKKAGRPTYLPGVRRYERSQLYDEPTYDDNGMPHAEIGSQGSVIVISDESESEKTIPNNSFTEIIDPSVQNTNGIVMPDEACNNSMGIVTYKNASTQITSIQSMVQMPIDNEIEIENENENEIVNPDVNSSKPEISKPDVNTNLIKNNDYIN